MEEQVGNPILHEFHIEDTELDIVQRFYVIKAIYDLYLKDDDKWHFFYEDEVGDIIRCSPEFSDKVKKGLDEVGFEYKFNDTWIETIYEVKNNPEYFADLFHLNSVYVINKSLKIDKAKLSSFFDRYAHNLFLNYYFSTGEFPLRESDLLATTTLNRGFYEGMRFQFLRDKAHIDYLKDKLDGNKN